MKRFFAVLAALALVLVVWTPAQAAPKYTVELSGFYPGGVEVVNSPSAGPAYSVAGWSVTSDGDSLTVCLTRWNDVGLEFAGSVAFGGYGFPPPSASHVVAIESGKACTAMPVPKYSKFDIWADSSSSKVDITTIGNTVGIKHGVTVTLKPVAVQPEAPTPAVKSFVVTGVEKVTNVDRPSELLYLPYSSATVSGNKLHVCMAFLVKGDPEVGPSQLTFFVNRQGEGQVVKLGMKFLPGPVGPDNVELVYSGCADFEITDEMASAGQIEVVEGYVSGSTIVTQCGLLVKIAEVAPGTSPGTSPGSATAKPVTPKKVKTGSGVAVNEGLLGLGVLLVAAGAVWSRRK